MKKYSLKGETMRIMVISTLYPESSKAQLKKDTSAIKYFVDNWILSGHEVVVLHPYRIPIVDCFTSLLDKDRFKVSCSEQGGVRILLTQTQLLIPHNYIPSAFSLHKAAKKIKRYMVNHMESYEPDVIAVSFPLTILEYCEDIIGNKVALCVLHTSDILVLEKAGEFQRKQLINRLNKLFKKICFRSDKLKERGLTIGIGNKNSVVLYSGIDERLICDRNEVMKKANKIDPGSLSVVFAGHLVERKNIHDLIRAVAEARLNIDVNLRVLGEGNQLKVLKTLSETLGISDAVEFLGNVSRETVIEEMRKADVFTMVSTNETFGLVYIEALAQGCIVIGTKGDGVDGVLVNRLNGFLVNPHDARELSDRFCDISKMLPSERQKIIKKGYETAVAMTDKQMSDVYLRTLQEL